jgi:hypothetical protein
MAESGISGVVNEGARVSSSRRRTNASSTGDIQMPSSSGQGGVGQDRSRSSVAPGQVLNIDGKSLDRAAPRGTYVNIVV